MSQHLTVPKGDLKKGSPCTGSPELEAHEERAIRESPLRDINSLLLEEKVLNASEADEVTDAEHPLKSKRAKNHLIDLIIKEKNKGK